MQNYATRRGLGRMLNVLQVGESVAQDVCAKIGLVVREEDYRNHAAAQAMDEARHHLAYRRFMEKMDEEPEDIDLGTEMMFDALLAADAPLELIATEQFFLESVAMDIFESIRRHARNPLLRDVLTLVTRDESRHMGFGVLYVAEWMRTHSLESRVAFTRRWLGQMLFAATDKPGPIMLARMVRRLREAGVADVDAIRGADAARAAGAINAARSEAESGQRLPQVMKSAARRPARARHPGRAGTVGAPADPGNAAYAELSGGHRAASCRRGSDGEIAAARLPIARRPAGSPFSAADFRRWGARPLLRRLPPAARTSHWGCGCRAPSSSDESCARCRARGQPAIHSRRGAPGPSGYAAPRTRRAHRAAPRAARLRLQRSAASPVRRLSQGGCEPQDRRPRSAHPVA